MPKKLFNLSDDLVRGLHEMKVRYGTSEAETVRRALTNHFVLMQIMAAPRTKRGEPAIVMRSFHVIPPPFKQQHRKRTGGEKKRKR